MNYNPVAEEIKHYQPGMIPFPVLWTELGYDPFLYLHYYKTTYIGTRKTEGLKAKSPLLSPAGRFAWMQVINPFWKLKLLEDERVLMFLEHTVFLYTKALSDARERPCAA